MGNGKKNKVCCSTMPYKSLLTPLRKIGGAPKQRGRLVTALTNSVANAALRAKARAAVIAKEERAKSSVAGATQSQLKKQRKAERALEKGKERAAEEAGMAEMAENGEKEAVVVAEGKGKRAREERERTRGTIPYKLGEKVLLVGEGEPASCYGYGRSVD